MNKMNIWLSSIHTNNLRKTVGFRIELGKNLISKQPNGQGIIELRDPGVSMYWNKTKKITEKLGVIGNINVYIDHTLPVDELCLEYKGVWADCNLTQEDTIIGLCEEFISEIDNAEKEGTEETNI